MFSSQLWEYFVLDDCLSDRIATPDLDQSCNFILYQITWPFDVYVVELNSSLIRPLSIFFTYLKFCIVISAN